ncbi:hypothetical protein L21SP3_00871 [Sedimentisphaera cyanobacteriorum]|uniref:Uncharacterized protein n=1 Tax=Sedimentisphaera cyanobacteriorum TaxID=1940790 RepID=A0A1Q2HPC1_9BACT|nr:hypothetical protein [Sedimentisphaera cyanobacteriorum]AQQ09073.1 hypothetical protein L21SP3_00871 [Sedimentisphaera cyanobacteriorum]
MPSMKAGQAGYYEGLKITDFSRMKTPADVKPKQRNQSQIRYRVITYSAEKMNFAKLRIPVNEIEAQSETQINESAEKNGLLYKAGESRDLKILSDAVKEAGAESKNKTYIVVYEEGSDDVYLREVYGLRTVIYVDSTNTAQDRQLCSGRYGITLSTIRRGGNDIAVLLPFFDNGAGLAESLEIIRPKLKDAGKTEFESCALSCRMRRGSFIVMMPESLPLQDKSIAKELFQHREDESRFNFYVIACTAVL